MYKWAMFVFILISEYCYAEFRVFNAIMSVVILSSIIFSQDECPCVYHTEYYATMLSALVLSVIFLLLF
jgi:hypothetical protein